MGKGRKNAEPGTESPQYSRESLEPGSHGAKSQERVWILFQLQWENHSGFKTTCPT